MSVYTYSNAWCRRVAADLRTRAGSWPLRFADLVSVLKKHEAANKKSAVHSLLTWAREGDPVLVEQMALACAEEAFDLRTVVRQFVGAQEAIQREADERWPSEEPS